MTLNTIRYTNIFFPIVQSGLYAHVFSHNIQQQVFLEVQYSENAQYFADREEVLKLAVQINLPLCINDLDGRITKLTKLYRSYKFI